LRRKLFSRIRIAVCAAIHKAVRSLALPYLEMWL
jgi:hypothetical protein